MHRLAALLAAAIIAVTLSVPGGAESALNSTTSKIEESTAAGVSTSPSVTESQSKTDTSTPAQDGPTTSQTIETTTEEQLAFINILDIPKEESSSTPPPTTTPEPIETTTLDEKTRKQRLSDQIRAVIRHYKLYGTVKVPDATVPEPMVMPNSKRNVGGSEVTFTNTRVYGLSNYSIEHVNTDLDKMQVYVGLYIPRLVILGNYTASMIFRKVSGPMNVTLLYVEASGAAALVRDKTGNLQASESEMDMTFLESRVKFGNMGLMGSFLQGLVASAGPVLFESIKPFLLTEMNNKVREDVNKKIKTIGSKFLENNAKPPIDIALEEGRRYVKENGYDPYYIENYIWKYMPKNTSMLKVNVSRLSLTGLSNFRRVGEVSLSMDSGTIQMGIHLATSKLWGRCHWSFSIGKFARSGRTNFTVDYVQGRGLVNQSLDVSQHPVLDDLDVNVGKVKIQMKGTGPLDFVIESVVNTLPDLIRHTIVDAIELPLKFGLQQLLSEINVEEMLEKQLPELDKMGL